MQWLNMMTINYAKIFFIFFLAILESEKLIRSRMNGLR